ncbi:hypothetical protein J6590_076693 [Homalodisca vitripennis]|nr:hypothetical protein J6590_076693 [Homalodisca vitripennis]
MSVAVGSFFPQFGAMFYGCYNTITDALLPFCRVHGFMSASAHWSRVDTMDERHAATERTFCFTWHRRLDWAATGRSAGVARPPPKWLYNMRTSSGARPSWFDSRRVETRLGFDQVYTITDQEGAPHHLSQSREDPTAMSRARSAAPRLAALLLLGYTTATKHFT